MKVAFYTLGCKVNQYETETLKGIFESKGHEVVSESDFADVYIINTCTVTSLADRKSRQHIRRAKKINPDGIVAVTGCYAQVSPSEAAEVEGVDIVVGNEDKMAIITYVEQFLGLQSDGIFQESGIAKQESKTRAFIKVQDGCNRFCSYCIIPYARGELKSRNLEEILNEAKVLINSGFKEVVLTGINTALYGTEESFFGDYDIEKVVAELNSLDGDFRIRLGSLEPTVINAKYVEKLFKYDKLCHHIHLSLQSGSDKVLSDMNRNYTRDEYLEIVQTLKDFDANYGITTDIIVGFPKETYAEFEESLKLVEKVEFCKIHVFKYSNRKGTAASEIRTQVEAGEKSKRSDLLIKAGDLSSQRFFNNNIGSQRRVLIEEYVKSIDSYTGFTDNYIKVYIKASQGSLRNDEVRINEFVNVELTALYKDGMLGQVVS